MSAKRIALIGIAALVLLAFPTVAQASFGIEPGSVSVDFENRDGTQDARASAHPYALSIAFAFNTEAGGKVEGGEPRDVRVDLPPGLVGNPRAVPQCTRQQFEGTVNPHCPPSTQIGILQADLPGNVGEASGPIYNVAPSPGFPAQLGFAVAGLISMQYASLRTEAGYGVRVLASDLPIEVSRVRATIWGDPADPEHTSERYCQPSFDQGCESQAPQLPYLTDPASCASAPEIDVEADSKLAPGDFSGEVVKLLGPGGEPEALKGCDAVPFAPEISSQTSSRLASSGTGLDFQLKLPNQGLLSPGGIAETEPQKLEVALPEGITANPSLAEGIATCSEAQYRSEQINTAPGAGCPEESKLGSIVAHSPLLEEPVEGALYLAAPYQNPTHSLIGLYLVARAPESGALIKQAGKVEPDPRTGRLITTFEGLPPTPYADVTLHFREGPRSPLITPPACGTYTTTAKLYPFSHPGTPTERSAGLQIERGVEGGACPQGALPFHPTFTAGSLNPTAGRYSPFYMRLTRRDGDQDLTKFSAKLPPGVIGRLAGTAECPEAGIARARSRTGEHGGEQERNDRSCPAASEIGHVVAGAGVGGALVYVPGKLYLAGPLNGAPLSVVAIVPALAGPFDAGTVVVRQALRINPLTAEVQADGSASDPIPHILKGIPLNVRDIRVYVDKPDFTLNPTSCEASATNATIWGGGRTSSAQPTTPPSPSPPATRRHRALRSASSRR